MFPGFLTAYLHRVSLDHYGDLQEVPPAELFPHSETIWTFFNYAVHHEDHLAFLDLFLHSDVDSDMAFDVLSRSLSSNSYLSRTPEDAAACLAKLSEWVPGGDAGIPGALWMQLAALQTGSRDWSQAMKSMRNAFASDKPASPGEDTARLLIGQALEMRGHDIERAISDGIAVLGISPWQPSWYQWYNIGVSAFEDGNHYGAAKCFRKVLQAAEGEQFVFRDMDVLKISMQFRLALSLLALQELDQAAELLRNIGLAAGAQSVLYYGRVIETGAGGARLPLGEFASMLLHGIHSIQDLQTADLPNQVSEAFIQRCARTSLPVPGRRQESQLFFDLAQYLKDPTTRMTDLPPNPPERLIDMEKVDNAHPGDALRLNLGDGVWLDLVWVPPGYFMMGSPNQEEGRKSHEGPQHRVTITSGFWMGKYPVTQRQFQRLMGHNPSHFKRLLFSTGLDAPVENVSWYQATDFCAKLESVLPKVLQNHTVRLPTEAEWEYACRGGTTTPYYTGARLGTAQANILGSNPLAEYSLNRRGATTRVGLYPANPWGLHDMHGNVKEWCEDGHRKYTAAAQVDPWQTSKKRTVRGGGHRSAARWCRSAARGWEKIPEQKFPAVGFRIILLPAQDAEQIMKRDR